MRLRTTLYALLLSAVVALPAQANEEAAPAGPQYVEMKPSFVGTIGPGPRIQYMKVDVALRANDPTAVERIQYHDPLIRNALVSLFGRQTPEELATLEGKEQLKQQALEAVRAVLEEEEGKPLVDDLLFTNLVTQ
ncbi:flagellar basal body-associated FliL family protein [Halopseudomonas pelagia]|uniref:Flagellar protein FliL n=1 Tax=Halopseudomonas pelagia TaxID=553151 RepID=A0AA91Z657_9GAMM|nr:flagellar basal body-associated FliL family protein [Halopseudomonas pelagia]PCC99349.1 flagellar basal body-associated protein FliL [Halopseudomonas pelagia]QFY55448.1 flagellar basal body-associated protein FliL [Halopseudomonas pelagia]